MANNLNIGSAEPIAHSKLAANYVIDGSQFPLSSVVEAAANWKEIDTPTWNEMTMTARLDAIKDYIKATEAEGNNDASASDGGTPPPADANGSGDGTISASNDADADKAGDGSEGEQLSEPKAGTEYTDPEITEVDEELRILKENVVLLGTQYGYDGNNAMKAIKHVSDARDAVLNKREPANYSSLEQERDAWRSKAAELRGQVEQLERQARQRDSLHGSINDLVAPY